MFPCFYIHILSTVENARVASLFGVVLLLPLNIAALVRALVVVAAALVVNESVCHPPFHDHPTKPRPVSNLVFRGQR